MADSHEDLIAWLQAALRELLMQHSSVRDLAKRLGVNHNSLKRVLDREGLCGLKLANKILHAGGWRIERDDGF